MVSREVTSASAVKIRAEKGLLLCCTRTRVDPARAERIRVLASGELDWPYLYAAAVEHGVAALLYWHLRATCPEAVPTPWMEQLEAAFRQNVRRNLRLSAELFGILESFRAGGVAAIPYKGPVLAEQAYGNLAFRQFADLDIVVRQRDVATAHALLTALGYRADVDVQTVAQAAEGKIPGQYQFTREVRQSIVELHTEGTLRYFPTPLDLDGLSRRLEPVQLAGREILTFSIEDALPILCVHGSKHFWERLSWIADIAELAQAPQGVDWEVAVRRARELGAERMLFLGLHLANGLLDAPLPEEIRERVRGDPGIGRLAEQVRGQFVSKTRELPGAVQRAMFRVRMRGNVLDGLRYLVRLATAPTEEDWSGVRLGGRFWLLSAVLRPFRLLRKYGLGLVRGPAADLARYVPTPPRLVERMLALAEVNSSDVVYDLGCGDGRMVVMAAKRLGARGVGVDIDPRRIAEAQAQARAEGVEQQVKFLEQDAKTVDLSEATVVTLYLRFLGSAKLARELRARLRPGTRVVSRDGGISGWAAETTEQWREENGDAATLYLWRVGGASPAGSESEPAKSHAKAAPR
jgi:hypothetical protein